MTTETQTSTGRQAAEQPADGARQDVQSSLSYEQARGELLQVVQQLEAGGSTLEESLELWERGEELSRVCREWLDGARERLDAVLEAEGEEPEDAPEEDDFEEPDPDADEVDDAEDGEDGDYVDDDESEKGAAQGR